MRALGIDIGGTSVKVGVLDGERVVATGRSAPYSNVTSDELRGQIVETAHQALQSAGGSVDCVGLCAPGMLDEERGVITRSVNLPGIIDVPLRDVARAAAGELSCRVSVCTDAHATAADVWRTELASEGGRLFVLVIGTGVGACVLDDGEPLLVSGRSPGHFGQLDVSVHEPGREVPVGPDGGRGSLEGYVGVAALMARYGCSAEEAVVRIGDDAAPLAALARALRIAHAMYRPKHVRLAGGIGIRIGAHIPRLRQLVDDRLTGVARNGWTLACAMSDFHAALGAAWISGR